MERRISDNIRVYGSAKEIDAAEAALGTVKLNGIESDDRQVIQTVIANHKLKATILYRGNTVWDYHRLLKDVRLIVKADDMRRMSNYLYQFLTMTCGSIAHYNKAGWIACYPTVNHLRRFFRCNEFGDQVSLYIPRWKTDAKIIASAIEVVLGELP